MAGSKAAGPLGTDNNSPTIDNGTLTRSNTPTSGPVGVAAGAREIPSKDPEIEALDLGEVARKAAYDLKKLQPSVKFTSGRRSKSDQARAMSGNVVQNRKWIEETYSSSPLRKKCQTWVDDNPKKTTQAEIATGLLSIFDEASDADLGNFSKHLSGQAFDVQPVDDNADAIKTSIRGLSGLTRFLDEEGGLVRWHAQF